MTAEGDRWKAAEIPTGQGSFGYEGGQGTGAGGDTGAFIPQAKRMRTKVYRLAHTVEQITNPRGLKQCTFFLPVRVSQLSQASVLLAGRLRGPQGSAGAGCSRWPHFHA